MAKSKSGGTRSMLRGRVGSDVYSIGKDAKGKRQQVVRSLAETVANPQTQNQMRGRMIMSTIMQAVAALKPIIDHSFDGLNGRQANISEFISRNYALIKADVAAHPASNNVFGLNQYQEKGVKQGAYVISDGQAAIPAALVLTKASGAIAITLPSDAITIAGLKSALGMSSEEFFTLVGIKADGAAAYERFRVNPTLSDETAISAGNIADVFAVEGNAAATIAIASNVITITLASVATCCAVIVTKKTTSGFIHSKATLGEGTGFSYPSDTALPTYPVGSENFLNGGDIFGQSESFNPGGGDEPTPSPTSGTLTIQTSGSGSPVVKDEDNNTLNSGASVVFGTTLTITCPKVGLTGMTVSMNGTSVSVTESGSNYVASVDMPSSNATLSIVTSAQGSVAAPTISGTTPFQSTTQVTMSAESGAEIRYTTDGSTPTSSSSLYSSAITLNATTQIKAIAIKNGVNSSVASQTFTKSSEPVGARSFKFNNETISEGDSKSVVVDTENTLEITLPEGDAWIGKTCGYQSGASGYEMGPTLKAGVNTMNITAGSTAAGRTYQYGVGETDDGWWSLETTIVEISWTAGA